jgi:hypothetical protein
MRVYDTIRSESVAKSDSHGSGWLCWFLAVPVLVVITLVLAQFVSQILSAQAIARAADTAAREVVIPRATKASVETIVARQLLIGDLATAIDPIQIEVRGPTKFSSQLADATAGDMISVTISVERTAMMPVWLRQIGFPRDHGRFQVTRTVVKN